MPDICNLPTSIHSGGRMRHFCLCLRFTAIQRGTSTGRPGLNGPMSPWKYNITVQELYRLAQCETETTFSIIGKKQRKGMRITSQQDEFSQQNFWFSFYSNPTIDHQAATSFITVSWIGKLTDVTTMNISGFSTWKRDKSDMSVSSKEGRGNSGSLASLSILLCIYLRPYCYADRLIYLHGPWLGLLVSEKFKKSAKIRHMFW